MLRADCDGAEVRKFRCAQCLVEFFDVPARVTTDADGLAFCSTWCAVRFAAGWARSRLRQGRRLPRDPGQSLLRRWLRNLFAPARKLRCAECHRTFFVPPRPRITIGGDWYFCSVECAAKLAARWAATTPSAVTRTEGPDGLEVVLDQDRRPRMLLPSGPIG